MDIKELKGHFDQASTEMKSLVERQSAEIKAYGETTADTAKEIKATGERIDSVITDIKAYNERLEAVEKKANHAGYGAGAQAAKSLGQEFIDSAEFKFASERGLKSVNPVTLGGMFRKDITTATGPAPQAMRLPEYFSPTGDRTAHIRNFLNVSSTQSNAIEYFVETFTNAAAPQSAELAAKAKSDLSYDLVSTPVQTLAHYVIASRQILDDAAMLRNQIDNRLTYGLALKEDQQLLYGTGTSGELEGLMVNASVQDAGGVATGDNLVDHIRKAIALASDSEYLANGIILNPNDFAAMELLKGDDGHYIWANVANGGEPRLWRVPVYESTAMTAGEFLLGNWNLGASLYDREQSTVRIAEQHADLFIKNGVVVLGEERVALAVYRPQAFVKGVFTAAV
jgi:HK97 family phage major capsid protein